MRRVFIAFCLCILAFGCGKKSLDKEHRPLKICFSEECRVLDPRLGGEEPTTHVIRMLFDGLVRRDREGNVVPAAAESYDVFENNTVYIFHLRNAFWSDGVPVTAHDFEYAWKKSLDPKTVSHGAQNFYIIKNAKESVEGIVPSSEVGVQALDDLTLRVELAYPVPYFIDALLCTMFCPIPRHLEQKDPMWAYRTDETFVSNGPFCLKKWHHGDMIVLEKNPYYWDRDNVSIPGIEACFVEDGMTQLCLFEKREIDWFGSAINKAPPEIYQAIQNTPLYETVESPTIYWYFINTEKFPFNHPKIRKAFSYALDRKGIADAAFHGVGRPAYGIISPCFGTGNPPQFEDHNFLLAQQLFKEALDELKLTVDTFPVITLQSVAGAENLTRTVLITQQNWQEAFGIKVEIKQSDWPCHFSSIQKGDYQIGVMRWLSYLFDPIYMLKTFQYKHDLVNMSNWESETYQALIEKSSYQADPVERNATLVEAEKFLMEEMPVIPICFLNIQYTRHEDLAGVLLPPSGEIDFKYVTFQ
ncbi:MAG: peptide ABC transporter substrate-binding protein [Chlamydiia bacterium]|nr:peptide ABC transporter substrate-binding protein [Chlamydiia bacterium]